MKPKKIVFPSLIIIFLLSYISTPELFAYRRSQLIPPAVDLTVRISNGAAFIKALKESPYGRLWNSPEMAPFLNRQSLEKTLIKSLLLGEFLPAEEEEGVDLYRKLLSLFSGEVVIGGGKDNIFALAEMSETAAQKTRELMERENNVLGKKTVYQTYKFQDVELIRHISAGDEEDGFFWTAFHGNTLVTTNKREWAEQCIVRLKKELPVTPPGPPTLQIKLPGGFLDRSPEGKPAEKKTPPAPNIYRALGVGAGELFIEWIILPSCSEVNFRAQNNAGNRGLWTLLSGDPVPRNLYLGYVPDDVLSYQVYRLDIHSFWEEIPAILAKLGPQAPAQFQMGLKVAAQMLQVDIERDFIRNLDTLLISYSRLEGLKDQSLYAWRLRNAAAMEKTLGKLFAEGGWLKLNMKDNLETLELQGHIVYTITVPQYRAPQGETGTQNQPVIEPAAYGLAVLDGDLVFGRIEMIRSYIHGSRDKKNNREFYRSPLFTRMIRRVPDNVMGYGFSDFSRWIKPAVNFLKTMSGKSESSAMEEGEFTIQTPGPPSEPDPLSDYLENLDFQRLPSPEFLRSFFGPWVSYLQFDGKEFTVKWEFHDPTANKQEL